MKVLGKQVYRFDGVEVDPSQGCLRRDGAELSVRQKSLRALLYLLEQRHRLVTKEELIEQVWEGMAVSDDALVQLIKEIRHSLGDDPRQPRFIKTVPKGGYRFIAPVEEFYLDLPAAIEIERHASIEIEYEEEISDETQRNGDAATRRMRLIPGVSVSPRRRVVLLTAVAAILLLAGATGTYLLTRSARRSGPLAEVSLPPMPGRNPVAVMYFDNQSGSQDLEWLREGLADMLITNLSRSKRLNVLSRQQLYLLLERSEHKQADAIRLDEAIEIGRKSQAKVIAMGSFARLGDKIRIDVHLHDAQTGQPLASESIVADKPAEILTQIDLLSLKLATHLGAAPGEREVRGLTGVVTDNLNAYRYYSLALEKAQAYHTSEAIQLWEKAIALDPEFAMAYARIGYTYTLIRVNEISEGKPFLERARQLSDRLTEKEKLYVNAWYAIATGDREGGIRFLREIISAYPQEIEAYLRLGYELGHLERPEEAIAVWKQGLLFDPEAADIHNALGFSYWSQGRYDEAIAAHRSYVELAPNESNAHDSLGLTYIEAGRYEEAVAEFERALALNPDFHFANLHLGDVYFQLGRYREAIRQYRRFVELAPSDWDAAVGSHRLTLLYLKKSDLPRAQAAARQELRRKNDLGGPFLVALASGDLQTAKKAIERLADNTRPPQLYWKWVHYFRGRYAMKSGRGSEAIEHLKEALNRSPRLWSVAGIEDCLAEAYLELGQLDAAIGEYERILRLNPNYPLPRYHLGRAYERKGQKEQARAAYERFLQVWKGADADVPELISARKALVGTGS